MLGAVGGVLNLLKGAVATPFAVARAAGYGLRGAGYTMRGGMWLAGTALRGAGKGIGATQGAWRGTSQIMGGLARGSEGTLTRTGGFALGARMASGDIVKAGAYFTGANVIDQFSGEMGDDSGFGKFAAGVGSFYLRTRGYRAAIRTPISMAKGVTFGTSHASKVSPLLRKYNEYAYWPEKRLMGRDAGAKARAAFKAQTHKQNAGLGAGGIFQKYGRDPGTASGRSLKVRWPWRAVTAPAELAWNVAGGTAFRMRQAAAGMGPFSKNPSGMGIMGRIAQSKHPYWGAFFAGGALAAGQYKRHHDYLAGGGLHKPPAYGIDPRNYGGGITFEGPRGRRHSMNSHLVSQRMMRK